MNHFTKNIVILEVGTEGGSITLLGKRQGDDWLFTIDMLDSSHLFLDEDDGAGESINHQYIANSLEAALTLMDRWPWHRFHPITIHPEFSERVFAEARSRLTTDGLELNLNYQYWMTRNE